MGWKGGFMVKTQTALAEDLNSFLSTMLGGSRLPVTPATGGSNQGLCPQQALVFTCTYPTPYTHNKITNIKSPSVAGKMAR